MITMAVGRVVSRLCEPRLTLLPRQVVAEAAG